MINCKVKRANPSINLPAYKSVGAAGLDVEAYLPEGDRMLVGRGRMLVPTGLFMEIPEGYEVQVRPRSGLALQAGVTVLNAPGTIDSDFRGELMVMLYNTTDLPFLVKHGERIAQLVPAKVEQFCFVDAEELSITERNEGGFGSTNR
jgi:dUTP pyrophosphatase